MRAGEQPVDRDVARTERHPFPGERVPGPRDGREHEPGAHHPLEPAPAVCALLKPQVDVCERARADAAGHGDQRDGEQERRIDGRRSLGHHEVASTDQLAPHDVGRRGRDRAGHEAPRVQVATKRDLHAVEGAERRRREHGGDAGTGAGDHQRTRLGGAEAGTPENVAESRAHERGRRLETLAPPSPTVVAAASTRPGSWRSGMCACGSWYVVM
jgi:hypothetical protein